MDDVLTLKILLIGDSSVGKSSLLVRYCNDLFNADDAAATVGVDLKSKQLTYHGQTVRLVIWDTAGQERFRTLTSSYYRGAHAVLLVYDITNAPSFANLDRWFRESATYAPSGIIKLVVGNKVDRSARAVTKEAAQAYAAEHGARYLEASAKTRQGVREIFVAMMEEVMKNPPAQPMSSPSVALGEEGASKGGCAC